MRRLDADAATASSRSALAHTLDRADIEARVRAAGVPVPVIAGDIYNLIAASDIALVASGTATLECALLECPMVIVYRLSPLTFALGRLLVRGVPHVGMPNIVAGARGGAGAAPGRRHGRRASRPRRAPSSTIPRRQATMRAGLREVRQRARARRAPPIARRPSRSR